MSKQSRHLIAEVLHLVRPERANRDPECQRGLGRSAESPAVGTELSIELLEVRLAPAYPSCVGKKTAGWGC